MSSHVIEDLTSSILDFQANEVRIILRRKQVSVDPMENMDHFNALRYVWQNSKLDEDNDGPDGLRRKWVKLGFESENVTHEFASVGVLGLDCLVSFKRGRNGNARLNWSRKTMFQAIQMHSRNLSWSN